MSRKATMENLEKAVEDSTARVSDLEKQLEDAKGRQREAVIKVRERKREMEQENNNEVAAVNKEVFWEDITPNELRIKWDELLLIGEVREYIESERARHKAAAEKNDLAQDNPITPDTLR